MIEPGLAKELSVIGLVPRSTFPTLLFSSMVNASEGRLDRKESDGYWRFGCCGKVP